MCKIDLCDVLVYITHWYVNTVVYCLLFHLEKKTAFTDQLE